MFRSKDADAVSGGVRMMVATRDAIDPKLPHHQRINHNIIADIFATEELSSKRK